MSAKNAKNLAEGLNAKGIKILNKNYFNEFVIEVENADKFISKLKEKNIIAGLKLDDNKVLVCTTEVNSKEEIDEYIAFC